MTEHIEQDETPATATSHSRNGTAGQDARGSRRRLLVGALGGGPALVTLASRSALAGQCSLASILLSATHSGTPNETGCTGTSPTVWRGTLTWPAGFTNATQSNGAQVAPATQPGGTPGSIQYDAGSPAFNSFFSTTAVITPNTVKFGEALRGYFKSGSSTFAAITGNNALAAQMVAAILNAANDSAGYGYNTSQIQSFINSNLGNQAQLLSILTSLNSRS
jgi:hypothetical protein